MIMKELSKFFTFCIYSLVFVFTFFGCKKEENVDVRLKSEIKSYVVDSKVSSSLLYTLEGEQALIKEWLDAMSTKNFNVTKTSSGINYIIEKAGSGEPVRSGDQVSVKYIGFFTDGTIFDASEYHGDGIFEYTHKTDKLITGWEEGIEVMSKGSRAVFLIPSAKAYGKGNDSMPPYMPLLFIIEVMDIE